MAAISKPFRTEIGELYANAAFRALRQIKQRRGSETEIHLTSLKKLPAALRPGARWAEAAKQGPSAVAMNLGSGSSDDLRTPLEGHAVTVFSVA